MFSRWIRSSLVCAALSTAIAATPALTAEETVMEAQPTQPTPTPAPTPTAPMPARDAMPALPAVHAQQTAVDGKAVAFRAKAIQALGGTLKEGFEAKDETLSAVLDLLAKGTGLTVYADKRLDPKLWDMKVTFSVPVGEDWATVLGSALADGGLRYLIQDEQIFISTPEGCAARLVGAPTLEEQKKEAADTAAQPFSAAEASAVYHAKDNDQDEMPSMGLDQPNYIQQSTYRAPVLDPVTGIVHYYAPTQTTSYTAPVSPYDKYSVYPYFLQPPYLDQQRQQDNAANQAAADAMHRYAMVLKMLEANPDMKAADILAKLQGK